MLYNKIVKSLKAKKAFTLVELIVVVSVLGVLVSVAVPVYSSINKKMNKKFCQMEQQTLSQSVSKYMLGSFDGQMYEFALDQNSRGIYYDPNNLDNGFKRTKKVDYWGCGEYDPATDSWVGGCAENANNSSWLYYYKDEDDQWQSYHCSSEGEKFLRYAYNIKPDKPAEFPSMEDGCGLYVTVNGRIVTIHCEGQEHERQEPYSCMNYS